MLRPAVAADRDVVLSWRNHPEVRRVSLTTHVIPAAEHAAWWAAATVDPDRRVLIFADEGVDCGVVLFDLRAGTPSWGFYLDVAGLGSRLLAAWMRLERDAVSYAFDDLKVDRLGGETLADNAQVLALHRRFGFTETRRYDKDGRTVVWTERGRA